MDIFRNSAAPYAFTILVSFLTWIFSQAVQDARDIVLVNYQSSVEKIDNQNVAEFSLRNDSLKASLTHGRFTLTCPNNTACLMKSPETANAYAQQRLVPPWGVVPTIEPNAKAVGLQVVLPPGAETLIVVALRDVNAVPVLLYTPDSNSTGVVKLVKGSSLLGWVLRNYYVILFAILIISSVLLTLWVLGSLITKWSGSAEDENADPETIKVILSKEQ